MKLQLSIFFLFITSFCIAQGSGNELVFDGSDDYVDGNNAALATYTNNFTIEMWINPTTTITVKSEQNGNSDISGTSGNGQRYAVGPTWGGASNAGVGISVGTNCIQVYEHGAGYMPALLSYSVALSGWNHIAVVYTAKQPQLYLNGVLVRTGLTSGRANVYPSASIGGYVYGYYQGKIDEFRIWSTSRTQTEIRDNMCQRLIGTETNLRRYYRFDNVSGSTSATDATGTQNGTLTNMATASCWVTSGAPIGNVSTQAYNTASLSLSSTAKGDFTVSAFATAATKGIHIYRVDAVPSITTGLPSVGSTILGSNDTYFGTFLVGTTPSHTYSYDYTSYPDAVADEANLVYYKRSDNSASWSSSGATLTTATNKIALTAVTTRGEYILTNSNGPLPIELLRFTASVCDKNVCLDWTTLSENNNDYFTVEKSKDGINFEQVSMLKGAGSSTSVLDYSILDKAPYDGQSYYRLKQTDYNGQFSYSAIQAVDLLSTDFSFDVYPNPNNGSSIFLSLSADTGENLAVCIYDVTGKVVFSKEGIARKSGTGIYEISPSLSKGIYVVKVSFNQNMSFGKMVVR